MAELYIVFGLVRSKVDKVREIELRLSEPKEADEGYPEQPHAAPQHHSRLTQLVTVHTVVQDLIQRVECNDLTVGPLRNQDLCVRRHCAILQHWGLRT